MTLCKSVFATDVASLVDVCGGSGNGNGNGNTMVDEAGYWIPRALLLLGRAAALHSVASSRGSNSSLR